MRNLRARLEAINVGKVAASAPPPPPEERDGSCLVQSEMHSASTSVGGAALEEFFYIREGAWQMMGAQGFRPEDVLFLDTETTGLSGVGSMVFLCGVGWFDNGIFRVEQYFMRDMGEEEDLLRRVYEKMRRFGVIVTFNGKSFDMPMLASRMIMHGMRINAEDWAQVDLLHLARSIWKLRLSRCSLGMLEQALLGMEREGDLAGAEVPGRYFSYLKTGDMSLTEDIIRHNAQDIISLVVIAGRIGSAFADPLSMAEAEDIYSLGRVYEKHGEHKSAEQCYMRAADMKTATPAERSLALMYKRQKRFDDARDSWQKLYESGQGGLLPMIELAKLYEHYYKDEKAALRYTLEALDKARIIAYADIAEIEKRRRRLERKISSKR